MKYGIIPWILFIEVKLSEASSEATKWWKMVDASLAYGFVSQQPDGIVGMESDIRHPRPLDHCLVIGWQLPYVRCDLDRREDFG
jgi:hypothetical protein